MRCTRRGATPPSGRRCVGEFGARRAPARDRAPRASGRRVPAALAALVILFWPDAVAAQPLPPASVRTPPARFATAGAVPAGAQRAATRADTLPPITLNSVLQKAAGGAAGGLLGIVGVGVPLIVAGLAGALPDPPEALLATTVGTAYVAGTTYGVHYMGRTQGLTASPWATASGVLVGAALVAASGLPLLSDDAEYRQPNLALLIPPSVLATGGFLLTRRRRDTG